MTYPKITFTVTTSRRYDLFVKTMDSFLSTCMDIDLIDHWICSDDRSTDGDLSKMQSRYPFIELHLSPKPGQAASINSLFSKVPTEWFFHCEDDWLFVKKDNYIRKLFDVVALDSRYKNAVLRYWKSRVVTKNGITFNEHVYSPGSGNGAVTDCDWYGYSFNPGMQHLPTVQALGKYDESNVATRTWDKAGAVKYRELDLVRVNLLERYIEHIGGVHSAYDLQRKP